MIDPIEDIDSLLKAVKEHEGKRTFVQYIGTPLPDGKNWCPDCEKAEPIILDSLKYLPKNCVFLTVWVGDRPTWKDPDNVFRKHHLCKVSSIPTLAQFNSERHLSGDDILREDLIKKLFEGE